MPNQFSSGKFAISQCDRCGFRFKLKQLRSLTIKTKQVNILVCPGVLGAGSPAVKAWDVPSK
jgi:PHP family Zn ribbon phosphoesterase